MATAVARPRGFPPPSTARRYVTPPTPLTRVRWRRVVLDEAQQVAGGVGPAARLASSLRADLRWAATGAPLGGRGGGVADDLKSLLGFLAGGGGDPCAARGGDSATAWSESAWWRRALAPALPRASSSSSSASRSPADGGRATAGAARAARALLDRILSPPLGGLLWRTSKEELRARGEWRPPAPLVHSTVLRLGPVERAFYEEVGTRSRAQVARALGADGGGGDGRPDGAPTDPAAPLTRDETRALLAPLSALRRACVHPQAARGTTGGAGLGGPRRRGGATHLGRAGRRGGEAGSRRPEGGRPAPTWDLPASEGGAGVATLSEVLAGLVQRRTTEAEEGLRSLLVSLHGGAALLVLWGRLVSARTPSLPDVPSSSHLVAALAAAEAVYACALELGGGSPRGPRRRAPRPPRPPAPSPSRAPRTTAMTSRAPRRRARSLRERSTPATTSAAPIPRRPPPRRHFSPGCTGAPSTAGRGLASRPWG